MTEISEIIDTMEKYFSTTIPSPNLYPQSFEHYLMMNTTHQKNKGNKYLEGELSK